MKQRLQEIRKQGRLHVATEKSMRDSLIVNWTYHSNAIEGNTLSLIETKVILEDGITIGGKTLKEHLEVIDHKEAILFVEELAKTNEQLTERDIQQIHSLVVSRTLRGEYAGQYRNVPVMVGTYKPPQPWEVPIQMEQLSSMYNAEWSELHPLIQIAFWHCDFVRVHPFVDGNGRTARLVTNLQLMQNGYAPVIIKHESRIQYYESLHQYDVTGNPEMLLELLLASEKESLAVYLDISDDN